MKILPDIFQSVKEIPTADLARRYLSLELRNGGGGRQKAVCPFHPDGKSPSLMFYSDGSYHCFGCGAHGLDGTDLVARHFGLKPIEAARLIARDHGIPINNNADPVTVKRAIEARAKREEDRELERAFKMWLNKTYAGLCLVYRVSQKVLGEGPDAPGFVAAANTEPWVSSYLDILQNGSEEQKMDLFFSGEVDGWAL